MRICESCSALLGGVILTVVQGRLLGVMRVIRVSPVSSNEFIDGGLAGLNTIINVGEILDQYVGLPKDEIFARVCHGRVVEDLDKGVRHEFAVLSSGYPPDGVRLGGMLIDQDEFLREVLRVEPLADGEVRYVAKVGTF